MKKIFILISSACLITIIYKKIFYPYLLYILSLETQLFILIILSLIFNINNKLLLEEIKQNINTNDNIIEYKYLKLLCNEISFIYKKIDTIDKKICKKINKSCNDLYLLE